MKHFRMLSLVLLCLPALGLAQTTPTPEEARKVVDYYFNGKGQGVLLVDYKLCQQVPKKGAGKYECKKALTSRQVGKGQQVFLWMNFLVPAQEKATILLQFERRKVVRKTIDLSLSGSLRHRTWKRIPTNKVGTWRVTVLQETDDADLTIGQFEFSVVKSGQ